MKPQVAHNECCKCGHKWTDAAGQYAAHYTTGCPKCSSKSWKWVNYGKKV